MVVKLEIGAENIDMAKTEGMKTRSKIAKAILVSLAVGGFVAVAMVIPNALQLLGPFVGKSKQGSSNRRYYLKSTLGRLTEKGFIEFKKTETGKNYARLTEKGKQELLKCRLEELIINKPLRWDGKWRMVIYDIKELKRRERNQMRRELMILGFVYLQNSVWIYPYECDEFITLLKTYYGLGRSLLYLVVDKLEDDLWLRENFGLRT